MAGGTLKITSANAVYMLAIPGLFPVATQLMGWGVDEAFDTEPAQTAEAQMGVDGFAGWGWIPRFTVQRLTFIASSPSIPIFELWQQAEDVALDVFLCQATIIIPATGRQYQLPNGGLTRTQQIPNARRVLQSRVFEITFGFPVISGPI